MKKESTSGDNSALPKIISLFSGAGGLDKGFKDAGFSIPIAIDSSAAAIRSHQKNFPNTKSISANLIHLGPDGVLQYVNEQLGEGQRIAVIGGPPCQGFSRANSRSVGDDPRNFLPQLYLDIVEELKKSYTVEFLVFENVLGIKDKKHIQTYLALCSGIERLGFDVTEKNLCALDYGVAQKRQRVIISGMRARQGYTKVKPYKSHVGPKTVSDVIGGLEEPAYFERGLTIDDIPLHPNHWTMRPKSPRFKSPEKYSSTGRSFRRLEWDKPSPTIAFGHREIHVHPEGHRRLSIYEAMMLQGFPASYVLEGNLSEQVEQVSNAVPPPLARRVARAVIRSLERR